MTPATESSPAPLRDTAPPYAAARWLALGAALLGLVVGIGGWSLDLEVLRTFAPGLQAGLSRSTAASFVLLGAAIAVTGPSATAGARSAGKFAAVVVGLVAITNLVALAAGIPGGVEYLLFDPGPNLSHIYMSPASAFNFLLASISVLLLAAGRAGGRPYFAFCATFGMVTALAALAGYAYDATALYSVSLFTAMAVHTAGGFVLVFLALLLSAPDWSWIRVVTGAGEGSKATRRLLPAIVGMPFVMGWLALIAIRNEMFSLAFNMSLVAIVTVASLSTLLIRSGKQQNEAGAAMHRTNRDLHESLGQRDLLLQEVYHRTKNNMQLVDSMITLESAHVDDSQARDALARISERVRSLAVIHQMLMENTDSAQIDLSRFMARLAERVGTASHDGVSVEVDSDTDFMEVDRAIHFGLIANELVTNALRHAFPDPSSGGRIQIRYKRLSDGEAELSVTDDGSGSRSLRPEEWNGVGFRIVRSLVNQLSGELDVDTTRGTAISVRIPRPPHASGTAPAAPTEVSHNP